MTGGIYLCSYVCYGCVYVPILVAVANAAALYSLYIGIIYRTSFCTHRGGIIVYYYTPRLLYHIILRALTYIYI